MIIIFAKFIDQLIDYPINCASLSTNGLKTATRQGRRSMRPKLKHTISIWTIRCNLAGKANGSSFAETSKTKRNANAAAVSPILTPRL